MQPRELEVTLSRDGYPMVYPSYRGYQVRAFVHQLVLLAFVGPMPEGQLTRHLDGNPQNNVLSNLRYGTALENSQDAVRHGRKRRNVMGGRCGRGHLLNPDSTYIQTSKPDSIQCKECRRASREASRASGKHKRPRSIPQGEESSGAVA